jgi:hypothetical protein
MSLGDFVKQLAALMYEKNIAMPFRNQRPWHFLLYELKKDRTIPGRPAFLDRLVFDWDGPFPRSRELSDFLHALHWNASVSADNPHYETIALARDVAELWLEDYRKLDDDTKGFLDETVRRAQVEFRQATDGEVPFDAVCAAGG